MTVTKDVAETARELVELYKRERDEARREVERLKKKLAALRGEYQMGVCR